MIVSNVSEVGFLLVAVELSIADHGEVLVVVGWVSPLDVVLDQHTVGKVDPTCIPIGTEAEFLPLATTFICFSCDDFTQKAIRNDMTLVCAAKPGT